MALVDGSEILLEDQGRCMFCPVSYALAAASVCVRAGRLERARGREAEAATLLRRAVDGYAALGQHLYERRAAALVRL